MPVMHKIVKNKVLIKNLKAIASKTDVVFKRFAVKRYDSPKIIYPSATQMQAKKDVDLLFMV